jgi:hypothetical protein
MGCLKGGVVADVVVPTAEYVRFAGPRGSQITVTFRGLASRVHKRPNLRRPQDLPGHSWSQS